MSGVGLSGRSARGSARSLRTFLPTCWENAEWMARIEVDCLRVERGASAIPGRATDA
jgi:hypothetical protein